MCIEKSKKRCLHLDSMTDVEIIVDLEDSFNVSFSEEMLEKCGCVGDLFQSLKQLIAFKETSGKCMTSMLFYRFCRALRVVGVNGSITPKTPLTSLTDMPPYKLQRCLQQEGFFKTSFVLASGYGVMGFGGIILGILVFITSFCMGIIFNGLVMSFVLIGIGIFLCLTDRGKYEEATVGDLIRNTVYLHYQSLVKEGAAMKESVLWQTLCCLIANYTDIDPNEIGPETRFH